MPTKLSADKISSRIALYAESCLATEYPNISLSKSGVHGFNRNDSLRELSSEIAGGDTHHWSSLS